MILALLSPLLTLTLHIPTADMGKFPATVSGCCFEIQESIRVGEDSGFPWGEWTHYHNYAEIADILLYLNSTYPNVVDVFSIGKSWQNRDIYCIRLTNESITLPKPKVFFVGYHHARELISAELPLYFAVETATNFGTNKTITHMLNCSEVYIVPALNVDGFEAVSRNEWQRKNARPIDEEGDGLFDEDPPDDEDGDGYIAYLYYWDGVHYDFIRWEGIDDDADGLYNEDWIGGVDLNRNYDYQWNASVQSGSPNPCADDYRGPEAFSELETQALGDLAIIHNFKYAISFHSGIELILYPWGYTNEPTPHDSLFREIAGNLSSLTGAPYQQSAQLYTTSGSWDDWMYSNRSTLAFTCEIYGNSSAWQYEPGPEPNTWWQKGVFQYFNPSPKDIKTVINRWLPVFTYIIERAITETTELPLSRVHNLDTGLNYITIQEAISANETLNGHTVLVEEGVYHENVVVNKTLILLGANREKTIIDGKSEGTVIDITADGVTVSNFTIRNSGSHPYSQGDAGLRIINSDYCGVSNNTIENCFHAIRIFDSSMSTLKNNIMVNNTYSLIVLGSELSTYIHDIDTSNFIDGKPVYYLVNQGNLTIDSSIFPDVGYLALINSTEIVVADLKFINAGQAVLFAYTTNSRIKAVQVQNGYYGIFLYSSHRNSIVFNNLSNCWGASIGLVLSENNKVSNNVASIGDQYGVVLVNSSNNLIANNKVSHIRHNGIWIAGAFNNTLLNNTLTNNGYAALELRYSANNNTIVHNYIKNNLIGIKIENSSFNRIFHNNFILNDGNAYSHSPNFWDNGYPDGGNYWDDYTSADLYSGPYQNEAGSDGIGDTPHSIWVDCQDNYPLMGMFYDFEVVGISNETHHVQVVSNSTVSNLDLAVWLSSPNEYLQPGQEFIIFFVEDANHTRGFCRITIPRSLLNGTYTVLVDWIKVPAHELVNSNSTHAYIYFAYGNTQHEVIIIPEFPLPMLLLTMFAIVTLAAVVHKKTICKLKTSLEALGPVGASKSCIDFSP